MQITDLPWLSTKLTNRITGKLIYTFEKVSCQIYNYRYHETK